YLFTKRRLTYAWTASAVVIIWPSIGGPREGPRSLKRLGAQGSEFRLARWHRRGRRRSGLDQGWQVQGRQVQGQIVLYGPGRCRSARDVPGNQDCRPANVHWPRTALQYAGSERKAQDFPGPLWLVPRPDFLAWLRPRPVRRNAGRKRA